MSNLHDQITRATDRLARLKARELLAAKKAKAKQDSANRRADAHRKIELGGLVIAAGADDLDPALLTGLLLYAVAHMNRMPPDFSSQVHERGIAHLAARDAARRSR